MGCNHSRERVFPIPQGISNDEASVINYPVPSNVGRETCSHMYLEIVSSRHQCLICGSGAIPEATIFKYNKLELVRFFDSMGIENPESYEKLYGQDENFLKDYYQSFESTLNADHLHIIRNACQKSCTAQCYHPFMENWNGEYHCVDCKMTIDDPIRLKIEQELVQKTLDSDKLILENESHKLGVTIGWLVDFTTKYNLWEVPTWKVRRYVILPETSKKRCRFLELDEVVRTGAVGPADTFASHTWGASFGDLVTGLADCADMNRKVWIDIFAVRQWPSGPMEFDFATTVRHCTSFVIVCSYLEEVAKMAGMDAFYYRSDKLSPETRKKIAFFRVWCLVEMHAAIEINGMAIVMKGGHHTRTSGGFIGFKSYPGMLSKIGYMIDIHNAEATVQSDRDRIMADIEKNPGGVDALNRSVRAAVFGGQNCAQYPLVQCAACGDQHAIDSLTAESIVAVASGGYLNLLHRLIDRGVDINHKDKNGETAVVGAAKCGNLDSLSLLINKGANIHFGDLGKTALMHAAFNGHLECAKLLIEKGANIHTVLEKNGMSNLMGSCFNGSASCAALLIEKGADIHGRCKKGNTVLIYAASNGHSDCVQLLIEKGADVNVAGTNGGTATMIAAQNGHLDTLSVLISKGADIHVRLAGSGSCALSIAKKYKHPECVDLLLAHGAVA